MSGQSAIFGDLFFGQGIWANSDTGEGDRQSWLDQCAAVSIWFNESNKSNTWNDQPVPDSQWGDKDRQQSAWDKLKAKNSNWSDKAPEQDDWTKVEPSEIPSTKCKK